MSTRLTSPFATAAHPLAGRTVLQIIPTLDAGGAERTTIDIAAALAQVGARALVATQGGRLIGELQARGGVWIPFPAATKNPLRIWWNSRALRRLIEVEAIDLIHARSRAPAWSALLAARRAKVPFVTTYHGAYGGLSRAKKHYNSIMARGDAVIANSDYTAARIAETWPEHANRLVTIPRGTDFSVFDPAKVEPKRVEALRRAWGVEPDRRIVLLAARLTAWKGQRVLIEAAAQLQQRGHTDMTYILAGDPQGRDTYVDELDRRIETLGLTGIVKRVGHVVDMPAAYLASSILTVPSIEPEAFGRSAVEAQAMGALVIVTDHGAAPETVLVPPGPRTGWRIPPNDSKALADAIFEVLSLGASAQDLIAQRARDHVVSRFSIDAMQRETLRVYHKLLVAHDSGKHDSR